MMEGQTQVVGLWHEAVGLQCPDCACKLIGTIRAERIRLGLTENWEWKPAYQWQVDEQALDYREELPDPTYVATCEGCGRRLDKLGELAHV